MILAERKRKKRFEWLTAQSWMIKPQGLADVAVEVNSSTPEECTTVSSDKTAVFSGEIPAMSTVRMF